MTNPHWGPPHQPVRFVGPTAPVMLDGPRRRRRGRVIAAFAASVAVLTIVSVSWAMSSPPTVSGSPVPQASAKPAESTDPERSTTTTAPTTTTSKRNILEPEPDANPAACNIVSWEDLPPDVRSKTMTPQPRSTEDPHVFLCWLDNSKAGVVVNNPSQRPGAHASATLYFKVEVLLGPDINADVNDHQGNPKLDEVRAVTVADQYPGVLVRDRSSDGTKFIPRCFIAFRAHGNKALAEITNDRFPQYAACDLAMQLAERIAPRVH